MSRLYRWPKKGLRVIYKIRHHRGHGIHSPFVYNLVRNVIEEKLPYYFYEDLLKYLNTFGAKEWKLSKEHKLIFRLVNHFNSRNILEIGSGVGVNTLCLCSPSEHISCYTIEQDERKAEFAFQIYSGYNRKIVQLEGIGEIPSGDFFDCICINLNSYNSFSSKELSALIDRCSEKSFIVVKGIRRNRKQNQVWKCLTANERRTAELDLYHLGIIFFNKNLYRWRYQISF